jgi:hypothetical protein
MDAASENPAGSANPKGAQAGCAFFGLPFFAQAKKRFTAAEWLIKVTRSEGAKALAVEVAVDVAVAFDNKQKHEEQRSKLRSTSRCHLHERPWIFDPRPSGIARWRSAPREPVARKQWRFAPAFAGMTVERWCGSHWLPTFAGTAIENGDREMTWTVSPNHSTDNST